MTRSAGLVREVFSEPGEAERDGSTAVIGVGDSMVGARDDDEVAGLAGTRVERHAVIDGNGLVGL